MHKYVHTYMDTYMYKICCIFKYADLKKKMLGINIAKQWQGKVGQIREKQVRKEVLMFY